MNDQSVKEVFKLEIKKEKPRKLNQTWIKDIGYDQAPYYSERSEERRVGKECRSRWSPYH